MSSNKRNTFPCSAALDAFGDQLDTLRAQLGGVGRTIGVAVMPAFNDMASRMSAWLTANQGQVRQWADVLGTALTDMTNAFSGFSQDLQGSGILAKIKRIFDDFDWFLRNVVPVTRAMSDAGQRWKDMGAASGTGAAPAAPLSPRPTSTVDAGIPGPKPNIVNVDATTFDQKAQAAAQEAARRKAVDAARHEMQETLAILSAGYAERLALLDQNLANKLISEKGYIWDVSRLHIEGLVDEKRLNEELLADERLTDRERNDLKNRIFILDKQISTEKIKGSTKVIEQINEESEAEKKAHEDRLREAQERSEMRQREAFKRRKATLARERELQEEERSRTIAGLAVGDGGGFLDSIKDVFDTSGNMVSKGLGVIGSAFQQLKEMGMGAINALAQGIGAMVQNWILMGDTGGQTFRQLAAQIIASVAQQAAILAVMSLAYAALATTAVGVGLLGGTPVQFLKAAALFGAVAVGAALVGRAVAGNSFQQASGAATGSGTGAAAGNSSEAGRSNFGGQFNGYGGQGENALTRVLVRINDTLGVVEESNHTIIRKFTAMSPHDVVGIAADSDPSLFGRANERYLEESGAIGTDRLMRRTGLAT